jgi:hypothetical protein
MLHDSERSIASLGLFFECMESLGGANPRDDVVAAALSGGF